MPSHNLLIGIGSIGSIGSMSNKGDDEHSTAATAPHHLIRRYNGEVIVFNLVASSRVKRGEEKDNNKGNEVMSETWINDDESTFLIARLINSDGYPWLLGHHGLRQIFNSPLVVPAKIKGDTAILFLRDFANRGGNCIRRKFYLKFASHAEASSFECAHNCMLRVYRDALLQDLATVGSEEKRKKEAAMPARKKRKIEDIEDQKEGVKLEDTKKGEEEEEAFHNSCVQTYKQGDELNELDDNFEGTQNVFDSDSD